MAKSIFGVFVFVAMTALGGCSNLPPFVVGSGDGKGPPAGPKVGELTANLKCELWDAANSMDELPYYEDSPTLTTHQIDTDHHPGFLKATPDDRKFTLKNLFQEIDYVADVEWTLDVTDTGAFNPSVTLTKPFNVAVGSLPATSGVLSVGGTLSEAGHRYINIYEAVDFDRLVKSPPHSGNPEDDKEVDIANNVKVPCPDQGYAAKGNQLGGSLGMKEMLQTAITSTSMSDINLAPSIKLSDSIKTNVTGQYMFGMIGVQVDFTIIENINGGPTWTLSFFKGPGGASSGLLNFNRQVKDTLAMTFVPVCIRQKYKTDAPPNATNFKYDPEFIVGTPFWANFLPPCGAKDYDLKTAGLAAARTAIYSARGFTVQNQ